jgi:hypothetical protein
MPALAKANIGKKRPPRMKRVFELLQRRITAVIDTVGDCQGGQETGERRMDSRLQHADPKERTQYHVGCQGFHFQDVEQNEAGDAMAASAKELKDKLSV